MALSVSAEAHLHDVDLVCRSRGPKTYQVNFENGEIRIRQLPARMEIEAPR